MKNEWIPNQRVGDFIIGSSPRQNIENGDLDPNGEVDQHFGGTNYETPDGDTIVFTEDGIIESVHCWAECTFNGKNLIGMSIEDLISQVSHRPDSGPEIEELDDGPRENYLFESLGAQVWVKDGAVSVICCSNYEDD